ncbi:MAG: PilZ domain-containing protein [Deltaproteobacteria bacterium]|nr:PilZ domain-containing protein [Deltaproteobacteria bacterium]
MIRIDFADLLRNERRRFFRVRPASEKPVLLKTGEAVFALLDISGCGCQLPIEARDHLEKTQVHELFLPGRVFPLKVRLRPVTGDEKTFGVEFVELKPEFQEIILDYIRARELELVRGLRKYPQNQNEDQV